MVTPLSPPDAQGTFLHLLPCPSASPCGVPYALLKVLFLHGVACCIEVDGTAAGGAVETDEPFTPSHVLLPSPSRITVAYAHPSSLRMGPLTCAAGERRERCSAVGCRQRAQQQQQQQQRRAVSRATEQCKARPSPSPVRCSSALSCAQRVDPVTGLLTQRTR